MNDEDRDATRRRKLLRVFGIISVSGLVLGTLPEILNHYSGISLQVGSWAFVLFTLAGALCTWESSIGYGAIGGALTALVLSTSGTIVYILFQESGFNDAIRLILTSVIITTVFGSGLGILGGLPIWLWRAWKRNRRTTPG